MSNRFGPRRELGRTGFKATILGIGDVADRRVPLEEGVATVRRALDAGLNLIDTAPNYEEGYSEQIVGESLRGRREGVFLIDKIDHPHAPVGPQVDASLKNLGHERVDLFAFHNLSTPEDWRRVAAPGGGMDQLAECVKAGKVRFRGISSHDPETLHLAITSGLCDVVMFPIGPYVDGRYVSDTLPLAKSRGVGSVCFKTFGAGKLLADTTGYNQPLQERPRGKVSSGGGATADTAELPRLSVEECLHYTLTLDPDVTLLGMSFPNEQDGAFAAARAFGRPLGEEAMTDIRRRAVEAIRGKGKVWWNPGGE
jgi:aryl-alcohol dehydrogenase-like predicted oxidoreductase